MRNLAYVAVLVGCVLGTLPLEIFLGVRVYRQPRRLLLSIAPVAVLFLAWDLYAIAQEHWHFDPEQTLSLRLPGGLPVEELLFFIVIPICAVLALEAVAKVRRWPLDDEQ